MRKVGNAVLVDVVALGPLLDAHRGVDEKGVGLDAVEKEEVSVDYVDFLAYLLVFAYFLRFFASLSVDIDGNDEVALFCELS